MRNNELVPICHHVDETIGGDAAREHNFAEYHLQTALTRRVKSIASGDTSPFVTQALEDSVNEAKKAVVKTNQGLRRDLRSLDHA